MPRPPDIRGRTASAGFASGPLWIATPADTAAERAFAGTDAENAALTDAVAQAAEQTAELMAGAEGDAADILEFQFAMLGDDEFSERASALISDGGTAIAAWRSVLDAEIEGYQTSEEEYFRARAADLADIRDRVLAVLSGATQADIPAGAIYVGEDITPSVFLGHDWTGGGIALHQGSATSHVAMLARQRGVAMITGIGEADMTNGVEALLDAEAGMLTLAPDAETRQRFEAAQTRFHERRHAAKAYAAKPARTAGGEAVSILVNIADTDDTALIDAGHTDGVGLMRSEFLFARGLPDEETQYRAYRKVLEWADGRPVTIRTVDAGGDKPVPGLTEAEQNPFLGLRGIRLSLAKPDIFAVQARALLRAGVHGNLKVMLPMVSVPGEIDDAAAIFAEQAAGLQQAGIAHVMPPIGIMAEVPSVAITPERFARAAFFSIGSNDLTQYVLAASRDNPKLGHLADPADAAVLALIANVASAGKRLGIPVTLCGDAGSDPALVPALLGCGLRALSVAGARIGEVKMAVAHYETGKGDADAA